MNKITYEIAEYGRPESGVYYIDERGIRGRRKTFVVRLPLTSGKQYLSSEGMLVKTFKRMFDNDTPLIRLEFENGADFMFCTNSGFVIEGTLQYFNPYRITHEVT